MKFSIDSLKGFSLHLIIVVGLLVAFTLFFFYSYLPSYTNNGQSITVPNLQGISMDEIDEFITKRNLRYEINDSTYSEEYPPLTILKQYPKAGSKVKEDRKIFISVNRVTPPSVPVPELVELSLTGAEAILKSNQLKKGKISYRASPFNNLVLEMKFNDETIEAGTSVSKGSAIDLVIGNGFGNDNREITNLVGQTFEVAEFILLGKDLVVGVVEVEGDTTGQESIVIKQEPTEGRVVKIGQPVDLWIIPASDTLKLDNDVINDDNQ